MIDELKIKNKLTTFLKREPTKDEITNGFRDQNIVNEIILDMIEEQNKTIALLQNEITKLKK